MKPKKFNNFKLKGNGDIEFNDESVALESMTLRKEVWLKLKNYGDILVRVLYDNDISPDSKSLKYLDEDLSIVLESKDILEKSLNILSNNTDYYRQMEDNFSPDY